jgi:hypothetical protein
MRSLFALFAIFAGCAQAEPSEHSGQVDANTTRTDSSFVQTDSNGGGGGVDSGGGPCTVGTYDILMNGSYEQMSMGWMAVPYTVGDPLINTMAASGGVAAQSPAYRAWLGGTAANTGQTATDTLYQDVAIPASTTALAFTGYYWVGTQEFTSGIYDNATVELVTTTGAAIETIKTFDDDHTTTTWTTFSKTIAANVAGNTVRLRLTAINDDLYPTNFYFDTLQLSATYCR